MTKMMSAGLRVTSASWTSSMQVPPEPPLPGPTELTSELLSDELVAPPLLLPPTPVAGPAASLPPSPMLLPSEPEHAYTKEAAAIMAASAL